MPTLPLSGSMETIVSRDSSPAIGQLTPSIVIVFLAISTATASDDLSSTGLICLLCCISSTVPQHDNSTSSAFALPEATCATAAHATIIVILFICIWPLWTRRHTRCHFLCLLFVEVDKRAGSLGTPPLSVFGSTLNLIKKLNQRFFSRLTNAALSSSRRSLTVRGDP